MQNTFSNVQAYIDAHETEVIQGGREFSAVEQYGRTLLIKSLHEFHLLPAKSQPTSIDSWGKSVNILPKYNRFLDAAADILHREGAADYDGTCLTITADLESNEWQDKLQNLQSLAGTITEKNSDMTQHITLLHTTLENIADIVKGEKSPTDLMFPQFKMNLVENIFKNNQMADYFNTLIALFITGEIEKGSQKDTQRFQILELGAGTGGTTKIVLEKLKDYGGNIDFYYTDLSKGFTRIGQRQFQAQYPFTHYEILDIEKADQSDTFAAGQFDLIYASNVLHATANLSKTVQQIHRLLKKDGVCLLNEITRLQDFATLTFGMLDGWWGFQDQDLRLPHSPLLSAESWVNLFKQNSFSDAYLVSTSGHTDRDTCTQSLVAIRK